MSNNMNGCDEMHNKSCVFVFPDIKPPVLRDKSMAKLSTFYLLFFAAHFL